MTIISTAKHVVELYSFWEKPKKYLFILKRAISITVRITAMANPTMTQFILSWLFFLAHIFINTIKSIASIIRICATDKNDGRCMILKNCIVYVKTAKAISAIISTLKYILSNLGNPFFSSLSLK